MNQKQNIEIFFKIEGLETYITDLETLNQVLDKVSQNTKEVGDSTKVMEQEVKQSAANATVDFERLSQRIETMDGGIKLATGSFTALAGAVGLLGMDENPFFKEVSENVINIIALSTGVKDASEGFKILARNTALAEKAQKLLNIETLKNPYVALAAAILAVAAALYTLTQNADENRRKQQELSRQYAETKAQLDATGREMIKLLDREKALNTLRSTTSVQSVASLQNASKKLQEEIQKEADRVEVARKRYEDTKEAADNYKVGLVNVQNALTDFQNAQKNAADNAAFLRQKLDIVNAAIERKTRNTNNNTKSTKDNTTAVVDNTDALVKQEAILLSIKQIEEAKADIFKEQSELEEELYRAGLDQRELAFRDLEDDYYRRVNLANGNAELLLKVEEQYRRDKDALNESFNQIDIQRQMDFNQMILEAEQSLQNAKFNIARAGVDLFTALAGENEKAANIAFAIEKALAVGEVIVNLQREISANRANPTWKLLPDGGATLVTAANTKARINAGISVASILATTIAKFKNGGGTLPPDTNGGFNGLNPQNLLTQANSTLIGGGGETQQINLGARPEPVRAYVVLNDINNAQQVEFNIQNLSKL